MFYASMGNWLKKSPDVVVLAELSNRLSSNM